MMHKFSLKKYICRIVFLIIGLLAGIAGAAAGIAVGWVADVIIERIRDDLRRRKAADNPSAAASAEDSGSGALEPFCGAELVCALAVYCAGSAQTAAEQLQVFFGNTIDVDWFSLCRPAGEAESLNGDLLAECFAALVKRNPDAVPAETIFTLISVLEFGWNETERGRKVSVYLAELLDRHAVSNELAAAYVILDVVPESTDAEIKSAHRRLVSLYHPDKLECLPVQQREIARSAFMRIQHAYEVISAERGLHKDPAEYL